MSEIRKVPKNPRRQKIEPPKIVGGSTATSAAHEPKVLDQHTKQAPVEIRSKEHGEIITVQSHVRSRPKKKDEPEVRLRAITDEEKAEWERVKSNQWEDE